MEGYVRVGAAASGHDGSIRIERLGAGRSDDKIEGVTAVWCAQHPNGYGIVIVGWYRNATVYRVPQEATPRYGFEHEAYGFRIGASAGDCVLLRTESRDFVVQKRGKASVGALFGRADLGYVDERAPELRRRIEAYMGQHDEIEAVTKKISFGSGETDPERNAEVEQAAIAVVKKHFETWSLTDVQVQNKGWDLEFKNGNKFRRVEVKGRSGTDSSIVCLSRNETRAFDLAANHASEAKSYRLAIVADALSTAPSLMIYQFVAEEGAWICELTGKGLMTESAGTFATPTFRK